MPAADRLQRQHDAQQMRALLESEPWQCFQRHLAAEIEDALMRVLDSPLPDVEAARGLYRGLRRAEQVPYRVIAQGKEPN
jgi:hypothetical protein